VAQLRLCPGWPRGTLTLLHAGVHHWIRRERFAVDIGVQQLRGGGGKTTGVVIGLAWYDL